MDLSKRLRNWGWYWHLRHESGLSEEELEKKYRPRPKSSDARTRFFFHVRTVASTPDERKCNDQNGDYKTVFELVHENDRFPGTREWYQSKLWDFLVQPNLHREAYSSFIRDQVAQRGWFRASSHHEVELAWMALGYNEPGFEGGLTAAYRAALINVAKLDDINKIALLCALFREAYYDFHLELAEYISHLLADELRVYVRSLPLPEQLQECLNLLIVDRVIRNQWVSEVDYVSFDLQNTGRDRGRRIDEFVRWYVSRDLNRPSTTMSTYPIVFASDRIRWLIQNKKNLARIYSKAQEMSRPLSEKTSTATFYSDEEFLNRTYDPAEEERANRLKRELMIGRFASERMIAEELGKLDRVPPRTSADPLE